MQGYQSGPTGSTRPSRRSSRPCRRGRSRYVTAPDSWTDIGHLSATPAEVLDGRQGTSLDTTVVLAAALEQAGLRPLVFVVHGHAFLGYWRDEHSLAGSGADRDRRHRQPDRPRPDQADRNHDGHRHRPALDVRGEPPPALHHLSDRRSRPVHGVVDIRQSRTRPDRAAAGAGAGRGRQRPGHHLRASRSAGADTGGRVGDGATGRRHGRRCAAADRAMEERPARPEPAQQADQLPSPRQHRSDGARRIARRRRGSGARTDGVLLLASDQISTVAAERGVQFGRDLPPDQLAELFTTGGPCSPM